MQFEVILTPAQIEALYDKAGEVGSEYNDAIRATIDYLTGRSEYSPLD